MQLMLLLTLEAKILRALLYSFSLGEVENNIEPLDLSTTEPSGIDFSAAHPGDKLHITKTIK